MKHVNMKEYKGFMVGFYNCDSISSSVFKLRMVGEYGTRSSMTKIKIFAHERNQHVEFFQNPKQMNFMQQ